MDIDTVICPACGELHDPEDVYTKDPDVGDCWDLKCSCGFEASSDAAEPLPTIRRILSGDSVFGTCSGDYEPDRVIRSLAECFGVEVA